MDITVAPFGWGTSRPRDVQVLLEDTASHLNRLLRDAFAGTIIVIPAPCDDATPRTHYRSSSNDPFFIQLPARDRYWAKFAYQFSHELCHVLSDYERLRERPNSWFHEAICELASVFTLRRMAESWPTCPPFPHWAEYAAALYGYADKRLAQEECQLPAGITLASWLVVEEEGLRQNRYLRDKNAVVAYCLLRTFEDEHSGWNAIRNLPNSSAKFREYLREWHSQVEAIDKPFVDRIIQLFDE